MGAGIAVEAALARPRAVASLLLVAPGGALLGEGANSLRQVWHEEVEALDRGDLDGAVEVNLRAWVDGPTRRGRREPRGPGVRRADATRRVRAARMGSGDKPGA